MRSQYWEQWITFALHSFKNWLMWVSFRGWRQQGRNRNGCGEGWTWQRFYGENEEERRDFWDILEIKPGGFTDNIYWHTGTGVKQVEMSKWTHEKATFSNLCCQKFKEMLRKKYWGVTKLKYWWVPVFLGREEGHAQTCIFLKEWRLRLS